MKQKKYAHLLYLCLFGLFTVVLMMLSSCQNQQGLSNTAKIRFAVSGGNGELKAELNGKEIKNGDLVEKEKTVTFTAKPNEGYMVDKWDEPGLRVSPDKKTATLPVTKVTKATTVKVSFVKKDSSSSETEYSVLQNLQLSGSAQRSEGFALTPGIPSVIGETEAEKTIFTRLMNASLRFQQDADVSEFRISAAKDTEEHKKLYQEFLREYPFIFHIEEDGSLSYNYNPENENELTKYRFDYKPHQSMFEDYFKRFEEGVESVYDRIREPMSDAEIAYVLHNAITEKTVYRNTLNAANTFGVLLDGEAVCQGYSLVYRRLLRGMGIASEFVTGPIQGDLRGHMWNSIQLDGTWYNLDVTWDDDNEWVKGKEYSSSLGKHFLTSDHMFYDVLNHPRPYAGTYAPVCTDTRYENDAVFRNGDKKTEPQYHEGFWYWLSHTDKKIYKSRFDGSDKTVLYELKNTDLRNPVYKRVELGNSGIYFIDNDPTQQRKDRKEYIYRIGYDGSNVQQHREILFNEASQNKTLVPVTDTLTIKKGKNALRGELMLSKMKDAYYHGTEDYYNPQDPSRKAFVEAMAQAESLLKNASSSEQEAERLYATLHNMRKSYGMERTRFLSAQ